MTQPFFRRLVGNKPPPRFPATQVETLGGSNRCASALGNGGLNSRCNLGGSACVTGCTGRPSFLDRHIRRESSLIDHTRVYAFDRSVEVVLPRRLRSTPMPCVTAVAEAWDALQSWAFGPPPSSAESPPSGRAEHRQTPHGHRGPKHVLLDEVRRSHERSCALLTLPKSPEGVLEAITNFLGLEAVG